MIFKTPCSVGARMIDEFLIKNFRSFNEAKVNGCRRINILVGDNGSGKTALLEALFLAAGVSPELAMRTRAWRGYETGRLTGSHEDMHQALWADLFHKFQTQKQAYVSLKGTGEQTRSVTIKLNPVGHKRVVAPKRDQPKAKPTVKPDPSPINFRWSIRGFGDVTVSPYFEEDNLIFPPAPASPARASFFAQNRIGSTQEIANRFSLLSRTYDDEKFNSVFNKLYPNIERLTVEVAAGAPMLYAEVKGLPEKIPLGL